MEIDQTAEFYKSFSHEGVSESERQRDALYAHERALMEPELSRIKTIPEPGPLRLEVRELQRSLLKEQCRNPLTFNRYGFERIPEGLDNKARLLRKGIEANLKKSNVELSSLSRARGYPKYPDESVEFVPRLNGESNEEWQARKEEMEIFREPLFVETKNILNEFIGAWKIGFWHTRLDIGDMKLRADVYTTPISYHLKREDLIAVLNMPRPIVTELRNIKGELVAHPDPLSEREVKEALEGMRLKENKSEGISIDENMRRLRATSLSEDPDSLHDWIDKVRISDEGAKLLPQKDQETIAIIKRRARDEERPLSNTEIKDIEKLVGNKLIANYLRRPIDINALSDEDKALVSQALTERDKKIRDSKTRTESGKKKLNDEFQALVKKIESIEKTKNSVEGNNLDEYKKQLGITAKKLENLERKSKDALFNAQKEMQEKIYSEVFDRVSVTQTLPNLVEEERQRISIANVKKGEILWETDIKKIKNLSDIEKNQYIFEKLAKKVIWLKLMGVENVDEEATYIGKINELKKKTDREGWEVEIPLECEKGIRGKLFKYGSVFAEARTGHIKEEYYNTLLEMSGNSDLGLDIALIIYSDWGQRAKYGVSEYKWRDDESTEGRLIKFTSVTTEGEPYVPEDIVLYRPDANDVYKAQRGAPPGSRFLRPPVALPFIEHLTTYETDENEAKVYLIPYNGEKVKASKYTEDILDANGKKTGTDQFFLRINEEGKIYDRDEKIRLKIENREFEETTEISFDNLWMQGRRLGELPWNSTKEDPWRVWMLRVWFGGKENTGLLTILSKTDWRPEELMQRDFWNGFFLALKVNIRPELIRQPMWKDILKEIPDGEFNEVAEKQLGNKKLLEVFNKMSSEEKRKVILDEKLDQFTGVGVEVAKRYMYRLFFRGLATLPQYAKWGMVPKERYRSYGVEKGKIKRHEGDGTILNAISKVAEEFTGFKMIEEFDEKFENNTIFGSYPRK